jgi:hypothetical protein
MSSPLREGSYPFIPSPLRERVRVRVNPAKDHQLA